MTRPERPGQRPPANLDMTQSGRASDETLKLPTEGPPSEGGGGSAADLELAPRPSIPSPPSAPAPGPPPAAEPQKSTRRPVKRQGRPAPRPSGGGGNRWLPALLALAVGVAATWFLKPDPAVVVLSSSLVEFGEVRIATASERQRVEITNVGEWAFPLSRVFLDGEQAEEFTLLTNECEGQQVAAGTSCAVEVAFQPSETGPRRAWLNVSGESRYAAPRLPLLGLGVAPQLEAEPLQLDFGEQLVGARSSRRTVRVTNRGTAPIVVESATLEGAGSGDFQMRDRCGGQTLAPNERCSLEIAFLPTAADDRSAVLRLMNDGADALVASPRLAGRGLPRQAALRLEPRRLEFEPQLAGTPSSPQKLKLINAGTAPLKLARLEIRAGEAGAAFTLRDGGCAGRALAPGRSCTVEVLFEPAAEGDFSAELAVRHDAGGERRIPLSGTSTVPEIFLDPLVLDFGQVRANTVSDSKFLRVVNSGSGALVIEDIRLRGAGAQAFTARPVGCTTAPIKPKSSCGVEVRFKPNRGGAIKAELVLTHNSGEGTSRVEIRGLGQLR